MKFNLNTTMKTTRNSRTILGLGSILALAFATTAFAGPGPQYWAQQAAAAKARAAAAPVSTTQAIACPHCKTTTIGKYESVSATDKVKGIRHWVAAGSKHECAQCGGTIAVVDGKTQNDMKDDCPICAKTTPTCCTTS